MMGRRTQPANGNELPRLPERKKRPGLRLDPNGGKVEEKGFDRELLVLRVRQ